MTSRRSLWIVGALAVFLLSGAADWVADVLFHPWALAKPPLLAEWDGALTTGTGERLSVSLSLRRSRDARGRRPCARCAQIEGIATTCDAAGAIKRYRVSGSPTDRRGQGLHVGAMPEETPPPQGLELSTLSGSWDGGDTLTLEADFVWRRGAGAVSSSDDPATQPVPLVMSRALPSPVVCRAPRRTP